MMADLLFTLGHEDVGWEGIEQAFRILLEMKRPLLTYAEVDAIAGHRELPSESRQALEQILVIGQHQAQKRQTGRFRKLLAGDSRMAVRLQPDDPEQWRLLSEFAPFSIGAWVYGPAEEKAAISIYDSSSALAFRGPYEAAEELAHRLQVPVSVLIEGGK